MFPLFKTIPDEESVDKEVVRKDIDKVGDLYERGVQSFQGLFGKPDTDSLVERCTQYWPDLRKSTQKVECTADLSEFSYSDHAPELWDLCSRTCSLG